MLERHSEYELREQWVLEQFWPVGEPAKNLRALISGSYCAKDEKVAQRIMKQLNGTYKPPKPAEELTEKEKKQQAERSKKLLKATFGVV